MNFTGGDYTTASVGADGKVTFDVTLGTAPVVTDGKPGVPGQAGAAGKDGIATVKTVVDLVGKPMLKQMVVHLMVILQQL